MNAEQLAALVVVAAEVAAVAAAAFDWVAVDRLVAVRLALHLHCSAAMMLDSDLANCSASERKPENISSSVARQLEEK